MKIFMKHHLLSGYGALNNRPTSRAVRKVNWRFSFFKQKTTDLQFLRGSACLYIFFFQIAGWCETCYGKIFVLLQFV